MKYMDLEIIKHHLNIIDTSFSEDDGYLELLWDTVLDVIEKAIDDDLDRLAEDNDGKLPSALRHAGLLLLATYYQNREHIAFASSQEIGNTFSYLIDLYRNYSGNMSESMSIKEALEILAEAVLDNQKSISELEKSARISDGNWIDIVQGTDSKVISVENVLDQGEY